MLVSASEIKRNSLQNWKYSSFRYYKHCSAVVVILSAKSRFSAKTELLVYWRMYGAAYITCDESFLVPMPPPTTPGWPPPPPWIVWTPAVETQVWSLTQFYSVDFYQSRIGVRSAFSTNAQSRFASIVFNVSVSGQTWSRVKFQAESVRVKSFVKF